MYGEKWFWPILVQLDSFEGNMLAIMPLLKPLLNDDSPDWSVMCLLAVARADSDVNGLCDAGKMRSREVGRILGAKFSFCDSMAKSLAQWDSVTPEQAATLETAMKHPGYVTECREDRVRAKVKPARTKREKDAAKRMVVHFFAALIGEAVEQDKSDLSWPEFHQLFMEATDYQVDIDEDTFKKILSRKGLKGVGKAGRPVRDNWDTGS